MVLNQAYKVYKGSPWHIDRSEHTTTPVSQNYLSLSPSPLLSVIALSRLFTSSLSGPSPMAPRHPAPPTLASQMSTPPPPPPVAATTAPSESLPPASGRASPSRTAPQTDALLQSARCSASECLLQTQCMQTQCRAPRSPHTILAVSSHSLWSRVAAPPTLQRRALAIPGYACSKGQSLSYVARCRLSADAHSVQRTTIPHASS